MPLPENTIGNFQFVAIRGEVLPPRAILEIDQRGGVDGTETTHLGTKGVPFQLFTQADATDYNSALIEAKEYLDLIEDEAQDLVVNDIDFTGIGFKIKVLNVTPTLIKRISSATGGVHPPSQGWIEAVWDCIAVEV